MNHWSFHSMLVPNHVTMYNNSIGILVLAIHSGPIHSSRKVGVGMEMSGRQLGC